MKRKRKLLKGSYDLYIINACNLNCKGCSVLDYKGKVTIGLMTLQDVKDIVEKLNTLCVTVQELKILGGEPTLHKQFDEIVNFLRTQKDLYKKLTLVTNGLNFTPSVINTTKKFDNVIMSVYPNMPIDQKIVNSGLHEHLKKYTEIEYWPQDYFEQYGEGVEQSAEENWNQCWQKDNCLTLTKEGLYHCTISMNEKSDLCKYENLEDVVEFVERDTPLDMCKKCPWPPKMEKWSSLKPKVDSKNYSKGVELINAVEILYAKDTNNHNDVRRGKRIRYGNRSQV